ncbi:MAG: hypothetical protein ACOYXU_08570 [Nitrospirota bacterium]
MIRTPRTPRPRNRRPAGNPRAIWLRRLDLVHAELASIRFPRTADESLRLCAALSAASLRALHDRPRRERSCPEVAELIARWDRVEAALARRGGRHQP